MPHIIRVIYRNSTTAHSYLPDISKLSKLTKLSLSGFNFTKVPDSILTLDNLGFLYVFSPLTFTFTLSPSLHKINF